jgi:3-hydroxymyristoyl/3-hydroxydecanoyl-(acyl carrier protein) dehydratase
LAERVDGDAVEVCLTADAAWSRGAAVAAPLLVEAMAQAAMLLVASPEERGRGLLAGIDEAQFLATVAPGDRLRARATLVGRLGGLVKLEATLEREGELVARAGLLLAATS